MSPEAKSKDRSAARRPVEVTESDFTFRSYNQAGREGIVATTQVPTGVVWAPRPNAPVTVALIARQTFSLADATDNQTVTLSPAAPQVPYMDDPTAGAYTQDAYIVAYLDSNSDGTYDTRIQGPASGTEVHFSGTFTTADGFVEEVDFDKDSADGHGDIAVYVVQRKGYARIQKRSSGKSNVTQSLQQETQIRWAFNTPNDPNSEKQITWDPRATGRRGALPPKFNLDIVFFDDAETVELDDDNTDNLRLVLPLEQRKLAPDEDPASMRARVRRQMAEG